MKKTVEKKLDPVYVTVKVNRGIKERVEQEKKNKFMPLGKFYDEAAEEKLNREKNEGVDKGKQAVA